MYTNFSYVISIIKFICLYFNKFFVIRLSYFFHFIYFSAFENLNVENKTL